MVEDAVSLPVEPGSFADPVAPRARATPPPRASIRELRLALVCYGGVSLAVYMHGVTKELQHLAVAARAYDDLGRGADPATVRAALVETEPAYLDELLALEAAGAPVTVVIDLVSGTSAGGINGVCLAKALAHNGSQEGLTDLWLSRGDLDTLLRPHVGGIYGGLVTTFVRLLAGGWRKPGSPLNGDAMLRWILDALTAMDEQPAGRRATLVPEGHEIDLFVTATDLRGYARIVPTGAGGAAQFDRTYRKRFHFRSGAVAPRAFDAGDNAALAFAARCTSSFPGAFAPVRLADLEAALAEKEVPFDREAFVTEHLAEYRFGDDAGTTFFVDGGLLDNAPFDHAVEAIANKPAEAEVLRRLVYLQPDPGEWPAAGTTGGHSAPAQPPSWAGTLRSTATIRSSQPILGDLLRIQRLNSEIGTVGAITDALSEEVLAQLGDDWAADDYAAVTTLSDTLYDKARTLAGSLSYRTYQRLKLEEIGRRLADDLAANLAYPADSSQASFVRAVLAAWVSTRPFWQGDHAELGDFLGPLDVPYRERRLRFIIAGINDLYGRDIAGASPTRADIGALKAEAWATLGRLLACPAAAVAAVRSEGAAADFLSSDALSSDVVLEDPAQFALSHEADLSVLVDAYRTALGRLTEGSTAQLWADFQRLTASWEDRAARDHVAGRYAGFPVWDALLFPVVALSTLPQLTPVQVTRFSPQDSSALTPLAGQPKLRGKPVHHFAAFFKRAWRENDYLWGRLDGVDQILALLRSTADGALEDGVERRRAGFRSVLAAENARLTGIRGLLEDLDRQTRV